MKYALQKEEVINKNTFAWLKYEKFGNSIVFLGAIDIHSLEFPENCTTPILKIELLKNRINEKLKSKDEIATRYLFFEMKNSGLTVQTIVASGMFSFVFFHSIQMLSQNFLITLLTTIIFHMDLIIYFLC